MDKIAQKRQQFNAEMYKAIDSRAELIQYLIPLGIKAAYELLDEEVEKLTGVRYKRSNPSHNRRWGQQSGSIYLGDQKVPVLVPRVRNMKERKEVPLQQYQELQRNQIINEAAFRKVLAGISSRDYRNCANSLPRVFGMSPSSVSRRFIKASKKQLKKISERRLDDLDIAAIFIDGKRFAKDGIIVSIGVTFEGKKTPLGLIQSATENGQVVEDFLNGLIERGLKYQDGILFIIDGGKGFRAGIKAVFGDKAVIQRCQWHKRENVASYLSKTDAKIFRKRLQNAYNKPDYDGAKQSLLSIKSDLAKINMSAANSLAEGLEETLTIHRLGLASFLGTSLRTTNCIESIFSHTERRTGRVGRWRNSDQKMRWVATALLDAEPRLKRIKNHRYLNILKDALKKETTVTVKSVTPNMVIVNSKVA
jgi:transposase-like protein